MLVSSFIYKIIHGYGVSKDLLNVYIEDLKEQETVNRVDWAATYSNLCKNCSTKPNIATLHAATAYTQEVNVTHNKVISEKEIKQQIIEFEKFISFEENFLNWIRHAIDENHIYPRSSNPAWSKVPSEEIMRIVYQAAEFLPECPEKKKLREHYKKHVNSKFKKMSVQECIDFCKNIKLKTFNSK